jgi:hypothetical protein
MLRDGGVIRGGAGRTEATGDAFGVDGGAPTFDDGSGATD